MKHLILVLSVIFFGCGKRGPKDPEQSAPEIKVKAELYKSLHKGWAHDKCDSLGFTSLCKLAGGCGDANIYDAQGERGQWFRSPEKNCFDKSESDSDISKDMFVMLFPYLFSQGDHDHLSGIMDYGKAHNFIMGRGPLSKTFMTPAMVFDLSILLGKTAEEPKKTLGKAGFEKHLDVIHYMTMAMAKGKMNALDYEEMRKLADDNPRNALMQALYRRYRDGNQAAALSVLLDEKLFPKDRLPTSSDRCEPYLWQRDDANGDWQPCNNGKTHDGTDFLIAAWVAGFL